MLPIHTIEISNPFFEGQNTVYVIESDPMTLIDSGVATEVAYQRFLTGLQERDLDLKRIGRVILTHKHIDHVGNAWRIQEATGADILIHERELNSVTDVDPGGSRFKDLVRQKMQDWHVPEADDPTQDGTASMPRWEIESAKATGLTDGQTIDLDVGQLEVIGTPGHTMGSICLRFGNHLFTGDHVLPKMSPNIGGGDLRHPGLLGHFFNSLDRVTNLDGIDVVMPGHGTPFKNLQARCESLKEHHRYRLNRVLEILADGNKTVYEVARSMFGKLREIHVMLGCAEANSHLEYLKDEGRVVQENGRYSVC